jgi:excisionase family DNA binding protein
MERAFASVAAEPEYLSAGEGAHLLRVSKASVYRAVERGELPALRLAPLGQLRIPRSALEVPAVAPCTATAAVEAQAHGGGMEAA